jgi:hypothetical protein
MAIPPTSFIRYDFSDPACYPGSGTTITDLSTNLDGSTTGSPTFVSDGQQSYFSISSDSQKVWSDGYNFPSKNIYTISAIFQSSAQNNFNTVLSLAQNNGNGTTPFINTPFNHTADYNFPGSSNGFGVGTITSNLKIKNDTWNLLTLTADGTTQKLYLNGILVGSVAHTNSFNGTAARLQTGYPDFINDFAIQKIAVMQMWESALTATQVKDLADSYATRFSLYQPIATYDFSETESYPGTGNTVFDLAGSNNLSNTTGATFFSDGEASYFQFAGSGNRLQTISPITVTSQTVFTFSAWAMATGGSSGINILLASGENNPTGGVPCIALNVVSPNVVISTYGFGVGTAVGTAINQNEWYLLTMTCDGTTNKIYINDTLAGSGSRSSGSIFNNPTDLVIGQYSTTDFTTPWIGKVGIYYYFNQALSLEDVQGLYNNTVNRFFPPSPGVSTVGGRQFAQGFNG